MSDFIPPHSDVRLRDGGDEREAPSAIVNACHSQVKWHLIMTIVCLTLVVTIPWTLYQTAENVRLMTKANRQPATVIPDFIMGFGAGCGFFALINALVLFRCSTGLRAFSESRRIVDLHRAMRRLRTVWRVFSISLTLVVLTVAAAVVWGFYRV
jgi:hypothetical protein